MGFDSMQELIDLRKEITSDLDLINSSLKTVMQQNNNIKLMICKDESIAGRVEYMRLLDENNNHIQIVKNLIEHLLK